MPHDLAVGREVNHVKKSKGFDGEKNSLMGRTEVLDSINPHVADAGDALMLNPELHWRATLDALS